MHGRLYSTRGPQGMMYYTYKLSKRTKGTQLKINIFANSVTADEDLDVEVWCCFIKAELLSGVEYSL